jgi:hypothetical protein
MLRISVSVKHRRRADAPARYRLPVLLAALAAGAACYPATATAATQGKTPGVVPHGMPTAPSWPGGT